MSEEFAYWAVLTFPDGTEEKLDLEVHGWAEPKRLSRSTRFALIPKDGIRMPVVVVNIPERGKPVFKSRRFVSSPMGAVPPGATPRVPVTMRIYAVGYKIGKTEVLTWVMPNGAFEVGPEPFLADVILNHLSYGGSI